VAGRDASVRDMLAAGPPRAPSHAFDLCREGGKLPSTGVRPVVWHSPRGLADVARLSPYSTCFAALPSRYGLGDGEPRFRCLSNLRIAIPALSSGLHQLSLSSAGPVMRLNKFFRDGRPGGSLLAFAPGNVSARIQTITVWHSLAPPSSACIAIERTLQRDYPDGSNTGLPGSACVTGLG
jgi:hypothetical protein